MDKLAQKRSLRSKFWESANLTGRALEGVHSELAEAMDEMRTIDASIREIATDVKPLVKSAKVALRQRDYLNAALSIAEFHRRVRQVVHILERFTKTVNIKHFKYLLDQFDGASREHLFSYNPNSELQEPESELKAACVQFQMMVKTSGTFDTRARKLLEKRFSSSFLRQLKDETTRLVSNSEKMLKELLVAFSVMESGISRRNVTLYVQKAEDLVKKFKSYHKLYVEYDGKTLAPIKAHQAEIDAKDKSERDAIMSAKQEENARQVALHQQRMQEAADVEEAAKHTLINPKPEFEREIYEPEATPSNRMVEVPDLHERENINRIRGNDPDDLDWDNVPEPEVINPKAPRKLQVEPLPLAAHNDFMDHLVSLAETENSGDFLKSILDYSAELENTSPDAAAELLSVAAEMINKEGGIFDFLNKTPEHLPGTEPKKKVERPEELAPRKIKQIDLPLGKIDQAFSDLSALSGITPADMRITPETQRMLINAFAHRVSVLNNVDDLEPFIGDIEKNLSSVIKQSVYQGWVQSSEKTVDQYNPNDRYLEVFTRVDLSDVSEKLSGTANLYIACRLSALRGNLTIRGFNKHFEVKNIKAEEAPENLAETNPEQDEFLLP